MTITETYMSRTYFFLLWSLGETYASKEIYTKIITSKLFFLSIDRKCFKHLLASMSYAVISLPLLAAALSSKKIRRWEFIIRRPQHSCQERLGSVQVVSRDSLKDRFELWTSMSEFLLSRTLLGHTTRVMSATYLNALGQKFIITTQRNSPNMSQ